MTNTRPDIKLFRETSTSDELYAHCEGTCPVCGGDVIEDETDWEYGSGFSRCHCEQCGISIVEQYEYSASYIDIRDADEVATELYGHDISSLATVEPQLITKPISKEELVKLAANADNNIAPVDCIIAVDFDEMLNNCDDNDPDALFDALSHIVTSHSYLQDIQYRIVGVDDADNTLLQVKGYVNVASDIGFDDTCLDS